MDFSNIHFKINSNTENKSEKNTYLKKSTPSELKESLIFEKNKNIIGNSLEHIHSDLYEIKAKPLSKDEAWEIGKSTEHKIRKLILDVINNGMNPQAAKETIRALNQIEPLVNISFYSEKKLLEKIVLTEKYIEQGISYLAKYPISELYHLVVDGKLLEKENGWLKYEQREPNSLAGVFNGLAFALDHLNDNQLTTDFICNLHGVITNGVGGQINILEPGKYRIKGTFFSIPLKASEGRATKDGFNELIKRVNKSLFESSKDFFGAKDFSNFKAPDNLYEELLTSNDSANYTYIAPNCNRIETEMDNITKEYNTEIKLATTDDQKILVIVTTIQNYELLHPFPDANGRVFVNVLLNLMLIQNGMKPATFYEPNIFDAHTPQELVVKIKEAQENTQKIINGENVFNFDSKITNIEDIKIYQTSVQQLENKIIGLQKDNL